MRRRLLVLFCLLTAPAGSGVVGVDSTVEAGEESTVLVALDSWPPSSSVGQALQEPGIEVRDRFSVASTLLVEAPGPARQALAAQPSVAGVYEDEAIEPFLESSKQAAGVTERLVEANVTGHGVNVAIVDSGVAGQHPGLRDELVASYTVDDDGVHEGAAEPSKHGTHVAGILSGSGEGAPESKGDVAGVAPGSELVSFDISSDFTTSNALRAFEWLYNNHEEEDIRVVTNAWGRLREDVTYDPEDPVVRASSALVSEGLVVVFSAGNGGDEASHMTLEGTNPDVITVGAATDEGEVESYSSRGPVYAQDGSEANWTKPDLVAPGSHVVSTQPGSEPGPRYIEMNGTSMAAPHVAGAAALLLGERPELGPHQVKELLVRGARDVHEPGVDDASGAGMLDAESSIRILEDSSGEVERKSRSDQQSGELTGPAEAGAVLSQANVDHEDAFRVAVPANATKLDVSLTWDGRGGLSVELDRPDGSTAEELTVEGAREFTLDDPAQGEWQVQVEPEDPSQGSYTANVTVTWLEAVDGTSIPFSTGASRQGSFPSTGGPLDPWASDWIPGVPNVVPMVAGAALTLTMLVGRIRD